jgi:biotin carboxyl carrier protein
MKYSLKVDGRVFEVEIENINTRPVIVHVDGIEFEVMPGKMDAVETHGQAQKQSNDSGPVRSTFPSPSPVLHGNALKAPLPGQVIEVFVKSGEKVEAGRVILIIEAMKMKNSIRSDRDGTIQEVLVSAGQSVAHQQALVMFEETG